MRTLQLCETNAVAGGNKSQNSSSRDGALKACNGLPDETKVTFSMEVTANIGGKVGGLGGEATTRQMVTIETTCGDLRAAEDAKEKARQSGG